MSTVNRVFKVDGKPFFSLGGQARNSSGYNFEESDTAFRAVTALHGNTVEIPAYWSEIEPAEGKFDFTSVDKLLEKAKEYDLKLVLLWFATWKNGDMDYSPAWVKTNPQRFRRVVNPHGHDVWVLSSHCKANNDADKKAFVALCQHLKEVDTAKWVVSIQIENEPGILGSDRDYGKEAEAEFKAAAPADLVKKLQAAGSGRVFDLWQTAGAKKSGSWSDLFGLWGGEAMTAWSIARYIDGIAEAGKAVLDIPMYVNVWLGENGWQLPGESYPSGGAVSKMLDIYRWAAPHVDLIAPDIYLQDTASYEEIVRNYSRPDNALFVPESAPMGSNAWLMFKAIADYNAIGYHFFAVESIFNDVPNGDYSLRPGAREIVESFHVVASAIPLLLKYQGTGKVRSLVQEEFKGEEVLDFEGYFGLVQYAGGPGAWQGKDWRHPGKRPTLVPDTTQSRGRGFIIQASEHEFYLIGSNVRVYLRPKSDPKIQFDLSRSSEFFIGRQARYVSVDEGYFNQAGEFVVSRKRNGDEVDPGVWAEADTGVVRIIMTP